MTEILNNTSWCEEEFITSAHQVQQCIDIIDKDKEYLAFLEKNKYEHFYNFFLVINDLTYAR